MRHAFYLASFKEIRLVFEESFPHEHGDAALGKDQSVQIHIEEIDDILDEKTYPDDAEEPVPILP